MVKGQEQPLLGLGDAKRLSILSMDMKGAARKTDMVPRLEKVIKQPAQASGPISRGQTQQEEITSKFPKLFRGLVRAKVKPVHIEGPSSRRGGTSRCSMWTG